MLHEMLSRLAKQYVFERAKSFTGSDFANFVRHDIALEAKKRLVFLPYDLKVKASVGLNDWAAVPWLAFFDPLITVSATRGFYVVYLVNCQTEEIVLSLNQGTTAVYDEFKEARGREVLRRRAKDIVERVPTFAEQFETGEINLGSPGRLPRGYEAGHAFGRTYNANKIDLNQFNVDLEAMLAAYAALIDRGGTTPSDVLHEESGTQDIEETRRYVLSRRIERAPNVRKPVLEQRGIVCEGCGFDPISHVGFSGPAKNAPVDVHHLKPINHLAEGESRRYRIPRDFLVLCPNCHRLIHKQRDPSDLEALQKQIKFRYAPKYG